jgi:hypothetical protein
VWAAFGIFRVLYHLKFPKAISLLFCISINLSRDSSAKNSFRGEVMASKRTNQKREPYQQKKPQKVKSLRNQPETSYQETKKVISFSLTHTAGELLKEKSKKMNISVSEYLERVARSDNLPNYSPDMNEKDLKQDLQ